MKKSSSNGAPVFHSTRQLSDQWGVSKLWLKGEIDAGNLKAYKLGNKTMIEDSDLRAWLESRVRTGPDPAMQERGRKIGGRKKRGAAQ